MGHPDPDVRALCETVGRLLEHLTGKSRALGPDTWLSVPELAEVTGKSKQTVRRWITRHGLTAKLLPDGYLVRYGDFLAWGEHDNVAVFNDVLRRLDRAS